MADDETDSTPGPHRTLEWECPRCDDRRKVGCPKVRYLTEPAPEPGVT